MFRQIFLFELRYRLSRPATYIYLLLIMAASFLWGGLYGGMIGPEAASSLSGGPKGLANSPYNIQLATSVFCNFFGIFIIAAIMGVAVYRDFEHKTSELFFTTPISKWGYLGGRFLGSLIVTTGIMLSITLGLILVSFMPFVDEARYGSFQLSHYLNPLLVTVLPNVFLIGCLFFSTVSLSRNQLFIYLNAIILLVALSAAQALASQIDNKEWASLLDPTGDTAFVYLTENWTTAEKNTMLVPWKWPLLLNRLIWVLVGVGIFVFTYLKFSFTAAGKGAPRRKAASASATDYRQISLPSVEPMFNTKAYLFNWWQLSLREVRGIIYSPVFIAILLVGFILMLTVAFVSGQVFETPVYPTTYQTMSTLLGSFTLFMLAIVIFYSGEMVWAEREARLNGIYDALPIPGWLLPASKLSALAMVQLLLLALIMFTGILVQSIKGYFRYELDLYVVTLFGLRIWDFLMMCVMAMFIQVLVNNKYLGFLIVVAFYLLNFVAFPLIGLEHKLYQYRSDTGLPYSDMNGYGHFLYPFLCFKLYWGALTLLIAHWAGLLWVRGSETHLGRRFGLALQRITPSDKLFSGLFFLLFIGMGAFIFYNTNILNDFESSRTVQKNTAQYEKTYKQLEKLAQPRITKVSIDVDLFPERQHFHAKGTYTLVNKTQQSIDSILLNFRSSLKIDSLGFNVAFKETIADKKNATYLYTLRNKLAPGDSIEMHFAFRYEPKGFSNGGRGIAMVENGTFLDNTWFPMVGYDSRFELSDDNLRKKYDLPPRPRMAAINDSAALQNNFLGKDADWIWFEGRVSTSPDQIAIIPGYLQKEEEREGRRHFHYKMDAPMLNFFAIVSARYEVLRDTWNDAQGQPVKLEIYYHKGHEYNLDRMMKGIKASLDYYTRAFSPYQHRQVRILEFPRYRGYAQSFANTIPYSEGLGFIASIKDSDPDHIDYPFYVTAHEMAHQWWAHQVIGADVEGSQFLSETMSQYAALMVMKQQLDDAQMRKFLKLEMSNYLRGRSGEAKREKPVLLSENQQYIHYNKGSVVMYALQDYIGEDSLNTALKRYIAQVQFQEAPYTTSLEWLQYVQQVTPDSLKAALHDLLQDIILYDNKIAEASFRELGEQRYEVSMTLDVKKLRSSPEGEEEEIALNDYMEVIIFSSERKGTFKSQDKVIYRRKHLINQKDQVIKIVVNEKPDKVGIDPYNKLIDRSPDDNTKRLDRNKTETKAVVTR